MTIKVECPGCEQSYKVKPETLGKKATCKNCGERFVLQANPLVASEPPSVPASLAEPEAPPEKPKGFFARMKEGVNQSIEAAQQKASASATVVFLSGPCELAEKSPVVLEADGSDLTVAQRGLGGKAIAYRTPLCAIGVVNVDSLDQITVEVDGAEPFIFGKFIGTGIDKVAERIVSWMHQCGAISSDEFETRNKMTQSTIAQFHQSQQATRDEKKAKRDAELPLKYLHGPFGNVRPGSPIFLTFDGGELVAEAQVGFKREEAFRISISSITGTELETAERMTVGRAGVGLLLAGPVGALIGGFGFKKKDKLLRIDFDDSGTEASIVFGKGPGKSVEEANGGISDALRQHRQQDNTSPTAENAVSQPSGAGNIADAIKQLAGMHEQGILTDDEFAAKKAELLSRI